MSQLDWQKFSCKAIIEVKQRIQTIVVYQELETRGAPGDEEEVAIEKEAVVFSYDRPMQAEYT